MSDLALKVHIEKTNVGSFQLHNIDFSLEKGYILGLVGRIGAGKTSLMKYIMKSVNVKAKSSIQLDGHIGAIMDDLPFFNEMTLYENAITYGELYKDFDIDIFSEYIEKTELNDLNIYGQLSKGEKIRFQFAFAMSHRPSLLILDEPTSGLDVVFRKQFLYMLQEAVEKEMISVIISTHIIEDLDRVADYIGILDKGSLVYYDEKENLIATHLTPDKNVTFASVICDIESGKKVHTVAANETIKETIKNGKFNTTKISFCSLYCFKNRVIKYNMSGLIISSYVFAALLSFFQSYVFFVNTRTIWLYDFDNISYTLEYILLVSIILICSSRSRTKSFVHFNRIKLRHYYPITLTKYILSELLLCLKYFFILLVIAIIAYMPMFITNYMQLINK